MADLINCFFVVFWIAAKLVTDDPARVDHNRSVACDAALMLSWKRLPEA